MSLDPDTLAHAHADFDAQLDALVAYYDRRAKRRRAYRFLAPWPRLVCLTPRRCRHGR